MARKHDIHLSEQAIATPPKRVVEKKGHGLLRYLNGPLTICRVKRRALIDSPAVSEWRRFTTSAACAPDGAFGVAPNVRRQDPHSPDGKISAVAAVLRRSTSLRGAAEALDLGRPGRSGYGWRGTRMTYVLPIGENAS